MSDHRVEVKPRENDELGYVHLEITGDGIPPHSTGVLIPGGGPVCPSPGWQAEQLARIIARVYAAGIAEGKRAYVDVCPVHREQLTKGERLTVRSSAGVTEIGGALSRWAGWHGARTG